MNVSEISWISWKVSGHSENCPSEMTELTIRPIMVRMLFSVLATMVGII